ncbi:MAG: ATP-binding protein [Gammaproteobacteria bacterium]|nr:ATP-binding protein [Gammaproteobacteria bacterium]MCF6259603.1 ATP-binding protein [Gammaproteobacteria bacterium]
MNWGLYTRVIVSLGFVLSIAMLLLGYVLSHDFNETEKMESIVLTLGGIWLLVMMVIHLVLRSTIKPLSVLTKHITTTSFEMSHREISADLRTRKDEIGILACAFDAMLSNLQKSYSDLEKREEHYRRLVETANVIPWELDLNSRRITYVGPQAKAMLGYEISDWYEEKFWLNHVCEEDVDLAEKFYRHVASIDEGREIEYRITHANGKVVWVRDCVHKSTYDPRSPTLQGLMFDVDERVKARQELQRYREHLERVVNERTAELLTVNQELQSFAHSLSQDLRVPLRAINGFSEAMLEDYGNVVGDEGRNYLKRICGGTKRMGKMIDDILILSRVTRKELYRKKINLSQMAAEVEKNLREEYTDHQVEFIVDKQLTAYGDEELMEILLNHLLSNAWKFTQKVDHPRVEVTGELSTGNMVYTVKDNGVGFDMQYVEKLFLPFRRLHNVEEFEGVGVGLAAVKRIVLRHGGKVWGEGKVDGGAVFCFTLAESSPEQQNSGKKISLDSDIIDMGDVS